MSHYFKNISVLLVAFVTGFVTAFYWQIIDSVRMNFVFTMIGLCCIAVFAMCAIANSISSHDEKWILPNLAARADGVSQPLQLYWFSALTFGSLALGNFLGKLFTPHENVSFVLLACIAIGAWLGVRISVACFSDRISKGEKLKV